MSSEEVDKVRQRFEQADVGGLCSLEKCKEVVDDLSEHVVDNGERTAFIVQSKEAENHDLPETLSLKTPYGYKIRIYIPDEQDAFEEIFSESELYRV